MTIFANRETAPVAVTILSVVVNVALVALKLVVGLAAGSAALVADAIHSASDLISDGIVLVGLRVSSAPCDEQHPYGHGKVETSVSLLLGVMLVALAVGLGHEAAEALADNRVAHPGPVALGTAALSIVSKEWLYRVTLSVGHRHKLGSIVANAWHHRSDALSSIAVFVGLGGTMVGYGELEQVAVIVVAILIARTGIGIGWGAYRELIDTAVSQEVRAAIVRHLEGVDGVFSWHRLRTRKVGPAVFVDVHVVVRPDLPLGEAHEIIHRVQAALAKHAGVTDVTVELDIETDLDADLT